MCARSPAFVRWVGRAEGQAAGHAHVLVALGVVPSGQPETRFKPSFPDPSHYPGTQGPEGQDKVLLPWAATTVPPCCLVSSHQAVGSDGISRSHT